MSVTVIQRLASPHYDTPAVKMIRETHGDYGSFAVFADWLEERCNSNDSLLAEAIRFALSCNIRRTRKKGRGYAATIDDLFVRTSIMRGGWYGVECKRKIVSGFLRYANAVTLIAGAWVEAGNQSRVPELEECNA